MLAEPLCSNRLSSLKLYRTTSGVLTEALRQTVSMIRDYY